MEEFALRACHATFLSHPCACAECALIRMPIRAVRNELKSVSLAEVVSNLGHYIDFAVCGTIQNTKTMPLSTPVRVRDASTVLMQSSYTC